MPDNSIFGTAIRGIAAAVPEHEILHSELSAKFGEETVSKVEKNSGVFKRHRTRQGQTTADLCEAAALRLLNELSWPSDSVDALILVTQTPDYPYPATACYLHGQLGLAKSAAAFDINLGCSGWVYGLWMASSLIQSGLKRILLLSGETHEMISPYDNYQVMAGDAGTATGLEADDAETMHFSLGTDGKGWKHIHVPAGASRKPSNENTKIFREMADGIKRCDENAHMNGPEVFAFTLREVPPLVKKVLEQSAWSEDEVDFFVFHQANQFMLDHLCKRMKLPKEKAPFSLTEFGNTSSASIPLTIQHCLRQQLCDHKLKLTMVGFGVGLSWGAAAAEVGPLVIPDLIILP